MGGRVNTMHLDVDWKPPLAILQLFSEAYFSGKNDQIWALNHDQDVFPHWILSHQIPWNSGPVLKSTHQKIDQTSMFPSFAKRMLERKWWELGPHCKTVRVPIARFLGQARVLPETFSRHGSTERSVACWPVTHATRYDDAIAMYNKVGLSSVMSHDLWALWQLDVNSMLMDFWSGTFKYLLRGCLKYVFWVQIPSQEVFGCLGWFLHMGNSMSFLCLSPKGDRNAMSGNIFSGFLRGCAMGTIGS